MCRLFIEADPSLWERATRLFRLDGMLTSVRLKNFFWKVLAEIGGRDGLGTAQLTAKLYHEAWRRVTKAQRRGMTGSIRPADIRHRMFSCAGRPGLHYDRRLR